MEVSGRDIVIVLVALAGGTYLMRATGPLLLGNRTLPAPLLVVAEMLPVALLAALVAVGSFGAGEALELDARAVGLAAAVLALVLRGGLMAAVFAAALATALVRLIA